MSRKSPQSDVPPAEPRKAFDGRATLTNEAELEQARKLSLDPAEGDILSLANEQAPKGQFGLGTSTAPARESPSQPKQRISRPVHGALEVMRSRLSVGDFSGALELARAILKRDPENAEGLTTVRTCEGTLERMYRSRIGPYTRIPNVLVASDQLRWLSIDHRSGFLLSLMDGQLSVDNMLDTCGMPRLEALQILVDLLDRSIIEIR